MASRTRRWPFLRSFYASYCLFFAAEILRKGAKAVLEEYVFALSTNLVPPRPRRTHPRHREPLRTLDHILADLVHLFSTESTPCGLRARVRPAWTGLLAEGALTFYDFNLGSSRNHSAVQPFADILH